MKRWLSLDSIRIDSDPSPLANPATHVGLTWPVAHERAWPSITAPPSADFCNIIENRRSQRILSPASHAEIVNMLCFALAPRFVNAEGRFRAPPLSSGALHAVDIVLFSEDGVYRLDRSRRSVQTLRIADVSKRVDFLRRVRELLPDSRAAVISLIGDLPRISAYYANPGSLLFRDAGALLQTLAIVAEFFKLGFCPLGLLGRELVTSLGLDPTIAVPVGAAVLGRRASKD